MRRLALALLLVSGPILLAAAWWLSRPAAPAKAAPVAQGVGSPEQAAALKRVEVRRKRAQEWLKWNIDAFRWMLDQRRTVDVLGADASVRSVLPLLPASATVNQGALPECMPRCAPIDTRLLNPPDCPAPTSWLHLYRSHVSPLRPPRNLHGPGTAAKAALIELEIWRIHEVIAELDVDMRRPGGQVPAEDIVRCSAEAAGLRLLDVSVRAPEAFAGLDPGVPLQKIPVDVRARGSQGELAAWVSRLARGRELWSVTRATLVPVDRSEHELVMELELFRATP